MDPTSNYWYYLNPTDGAMLSGWQEINEVLHVFLVPEKIYFAFFKGGMSFA